MKRALFVAILAGTLVLFVGSFALAGGRIAHRQINHHKRIAQGRRSGTITNKEFVRLKHEQGRIQTAKRRAHSDGYLSPRERHHIATMQDRASKHIYWAKHNRKTYSPHRPHPGAYRRPVYHRYERHHYRPRHVHHYQPSTAPCYASYFSAAIAQPGWSVAWSVGLD